MNAHKAKQQSQAAKNATKAQNDQAERNRIDNASDAIIKMVDSAIQLAIENGETRAAIYHVGLFEGVRLNSHSWALKGVADAVWEKLKPWELKGFVILLEDLSSIGYDKSIVDGFPWISLDWSGRVRWK